MPDFVVTATRSAEKELLGLPTAVRDRFIEVMRRLRDAPGFPPPGLDFIRLKGTRDGWRLRIGSYRAFCALQGCEIVFTRFGHRSTVYIR